MRDSTAVAIRGAMCMLLPAAAIAALVGNSTLGGSEDSQNAPLLPPVNRPAAARLAPYSPDPSHSWNRLHQALFVREAPDGSPRVHSTDPLLYQGGTFLLEGQPHRRAVALLDEFLAQRAERSFDNGLKKIFFQRDLWAAFDYMAWVPDDWVHYSRNEPAAIALRTRLAKAIGRLSLSDQEFAALPDNYAMAVKSKEYRTAYNPEHREQQFLPADLFDPTGAWVRFHDVTAAPMAEKHFEAAGGRAIHVIFLRLPGGRTATEQYLSELKRDSNKQFPPGTMVAMVRRPLAIDAARKVRVTPLTELVQIRVYRRIPSDPQANYHGDFGEQDVYEFALDRAALFAGQHGLRPVSPNDPAEPFARNESDPFDRAAHRSAGEPPVRQLTTCIQCHQAPGVYSVMSMRRGLRARDKELFRNYDWDVEMKYTVQAKVKQFNWGLLQGMLEAR